MKNEEQVYMVPLGKAYDYKRTKRAVRAVDLLREFAYRHSKAQEVNVSMKVNEFIWSRSIQKPPRKIKIKIVKKGETAYVYLPDEKITEETPIVQTKKETATTEIKKETETKKGEAGREPEKKQVAETKGIAEKKEEPKKTEKKAKEEKSK
ncbi:MAG: 50S ribosomal protein L31e [Candidatus Micrarchaeia archaeon]|jgi:large subunit ribosomal protein L31e